MNEVKIDFKTQNQYLYNMSAKICKITDLKVMIGYDTIELASILGWQVVVKKREYQVGYLVIYYSIGSVLPNEGETAFLEGKRLKTKKFREYISQGLVGPLEWLRKRAVNDVIVNEDDDVTQIMGVEKFIPEEEKSVYAPENGNRAPWPQHIPKTDEDRAQNCLHRLSKGSQGIENIVITQKYDGTSTTFFFSGNLFGICSRNNRLLAPEASSKLYFDMAAKYNLNEKMVALGRNIAIQGETVGPKINGNRMKRSDVDFFVFNVYDIDRGEYMLWDEIVQICDILGLKTVKVVYRGPIIPDQHLSIQWLLSYSDSQTYESSAPCEGVVLKTDSPGFRFSCKIISNQYILKYGL